MFTPMMSLLVLSMITIPAIMTGKINTQFAKVTAGFVLSLFSSTFILMFIVVLLIVANIFV